MSNYIKNRIEILGSGSQTIQVIDKYNTHQLSALNKADDGTIICRNINNDRLTGYYNLKTGVFQERFKEAVIGLPDFWELEIIETSDYFPDFRKVIPRPKNIPSSDEGEEMTEEEYQWNMKNWGTGGNCFDCVRLDYNIFAFETVYCGASVIVREMSKQFPDVEFIYEYADENIGYNVGAYRLKNGIIEESHLPQEGSKDAYDIAFKLYPDLKENYLLVGETYLSID